MYFHLPRTCGSGSPLGGRTQAVSWALGEGGRGHLLLFSGALRCQGGWGVRPQARCMEPTLGLAVSGFYR